MVDPTPDTTRQAPAPLDVTSWRRKLEQLAKDADLAGGQAGLEQRQQLAERWFALCWLACSLSWISQSCRLSARLSEPLLATPEALDLQVLHAYNARLSALKSVGAIGEAKVDLLAPPGTLPDDEPDAPEQATPTPTPTPEPVEVEQVEQPAPVRLQVKAPPREPRKLRPAAERMAARPPAPAAEPAPPAAAEPDQDTAPVPVGWGDPPDPVPPAPAPAPAPATVPGWGGEPVPVTEPPPPAPAAAPEQATWPEVPPNWLKAGEASEVLGITREQLHRKRLAGETGTVGVDWIQCGPKSFYFSPHLVEELEAALSAPDLDALLTDMRG
jgi:hypothetical protein